MSTEVDELCDGSIGALMVTAMGEHYTVGIVQIGGAVVSPISMYDIFGRTARRIRALTNEPTIGGDPIRAGALGRLSSLLRSAWVFSRLIAAAGQRGANTEEALERICPGTRQELDIRFGGAAITAERSVAWQEKIRSGMEAWRDGLMKFVEDESWGEFQL